MGYSPWGLKESDTTERLYLLTYLHGKKDVLNLIPFGILRWEIIPHCLNRYNIVTGVLLRKKRETE